MAENAASTPQADANTDAVDSPDGVVALEVEGPPETAFWKRYNDRLEMPTSIVGSICMHCGLVFMLLICLNYFMKTEKPIIPISMIDGEDDKGNGSPGSGSVADPAVIGTYQPSAQDFANLKTPQALPRIQDIQDKLNAESTESDIKMPESDQLAYASLDKALADKLLGIGQNKGEGGSTGRGNSGQVGSGPGGFGADSTRARSMRWVMRFNVQDGRDYLRQLAVLKATVLIPIPPANKDMMIFKDLTSGQPNRLATTAEIDELSRQMRFCDITSKATIEIASTYKLNFTPQCFFAFFPKDLEARLARDEENFRGRKAKDIEETIFSVTVRGESFDIRIVDQTPKRR
ncbi:MAG: hypothetical protein U0798_17195 [Gemmataceae bacterium]